MQDGRMERRGGERERRREGGEDRERGKRRDRGEEGGGQVKRHNHERRTQEKVIKAQICQNPDGRINRNKANGDFNEP